MLEIEQLFSLAREIRAIERKLAGTEAYFAHDTSEMLNYAAEELYEATKNGFRPESRKWLLEMCQYVEEISERIAKAEDLLCDPLEDADTILPDRISTKLLSIAREIAQNSWNSK